MTQQPAAPPAQWTKLDRIRYLLDQWDTIFDPSATSPTGVPGDGTGIPLMPLMASHPSVVELARCLRVLLNVDPGGYRYLARYRCGCEWRIVWTPTLIRGPHGRMLPGDPQPRRQRILPAWLANAKRCDCQDTGCSGIQRVHQAEHFLTDRFNGDVFIPDELWKALTAPAEAA